MNNTAEKFYLILSEYVGPNRKDSRGHWIGDSRVMNICSRAGRTNSSRQELINGWLGTTNDNSLTACGEYDSIEAARSEAHRLGFTSEAVSEDEYPSIDDDDDTIVQWISPVAAREQWDADDWFHTGCSRDDTRQNYGITDKTTDDELDAIIETAEAEAEANNAEPHGLDDLFYELRNELIDEEE